MTGPDSTLPPWPDLIAEMGLLKQRVSAADPTHKFTIPGVAATPDQLVAAERRLRHPLDPMHREFLSYGNGWVDLYLRNSLLATEEIGQGGPWQDLDARLSAFYEGADGLAGVPARDQIYPISYDRHGSSIFAIWLGGPQTNGGCPVSWLPWADTEPFDNFFEFFAFVYHSHEKVLTGTD